MLIVGAVSRALRVSDGVSKHDVGGGAWTPFVVAHAEVGWVADRTWGRSWRDSRLAEKRSCLLNELQLVCRRRAEGLVRCLEKDSCWFQRLALYPMCKPGGNSCEVLRAEAPMHLVCDTTVAKRRLCLGIRYGTLQGYSV